MTPEEYLVKANEAIDTAAKLEANWNSYHALPIKPAALAAARALAKSIAYLDGWSDARDALPYPMATGGMAFEWRDRSIWVYPDGCYKAESWHSDDLHKNLEVAHKFLMDVSPPDRD